MKPRISEKSTATGRLSPPSFTASALFAMRAAKCGVKNRSKLLRTSASRRMCSPNWRVLDRDRRNPGERNEKVEVGLAEPLRVLKVVHVQHAEDVVLRADERRAQRGAYALHQDGVPGEALVFARVVREQRDLFFHGHARDRLWDRLRRVGATLVARDFRVELPELVDDEDRAAVGLENLEGVVGDFLQQRVHVGGAREPLGDFEQDLQFLPVLLRRIGVPGHDCLDAAGAPAERGDIVARGRHEADNRRVRGRNGRHRRGRCREHRDPHWDRERWRAVTGRRALLDAERDLAEGEWVSPGDHEVILVDLHAVDEGSVARPGVLHLHTALSDGHFGVPPRDGGVDDGTVRVCGAPHDHRHTGPQLEAVLVLDAGELEWHWAKYARTPSRGQSHGR